MSDDTWEAEIKAILTGAACKAAGGSWNGGHDVSGHVFMLVLASAFLALEALGTSAPTSPVHNNNNNNSSVVAGTENNNDINGIDKDELDGENAANKNQLSIYASRFVWVVIGLSWWMLFMTAIWFHTWLEKVSLVFITKKKKEVNLTNHASSCPVS